MTSENLERLQAILGHEFNDQDLLARALTHSSATHESRGEAEHYERLEFLGDAVLELVVSHMLLEKFPASREGELSQARASAVNRRTLAAIARRLRLGEFVRMSHGEEKTGGREKDTILADVFEAAVGAVYLDGGLGAAAAFIEGHFDLLFDGIDQRLRFTDYKTRLQEITQASAGRPPTYRVTGSSGPDHEKQFVIEVWIGERRLGRGEGTSKKAAEQAAARAALALLGETPATEE